MSVCAVAPLVWFFFSIIPLDYFVLLPLQLIRLFPPPLRPRDFIPCMNYFVLSVSLSSIKPPQLIHVSIVFVSRLQDRPTAVLQPGSHGEQEDAAPHAATVERTFSGTSQVIFATFAAASPRLPVDATVAEQCLPESSAVSEFGLEFCSSQCTVAQRATAIAR